MRLVTYRSAAEPRAGVLVGDQVIDAWIAIGEPQHASLRELIAEAKLEELDSALEAEDLAQGSASAGSIAELELLPPIPDPEKIVCIGLNYRSHAAEAGIDPPQSPAIFAKYRNALAAAGAAVKLPAASHKVDYEGEVAFIIGRRASAVRRARGSRAHSWVHPP